jgi:hypothetical protein
MFSIRYSMGLGMGYLLGKIKKTPLEKGASSSGGESGI